MGYSWFRAESDAVDHPKVMALASGLAVELALADGYLFRLWSWTQRYAPTGAFSARVVPQLEAYVGRKGVIEAMREVGLIDAVGDDFSVHDWEEMQGALVEKAKRDATLKRKKRRQNGAQTARKRRAPGAQTARKRRAPGAQTAPLQDRTGQDVQNGQDTKLPRPTSMKPEPEDLLQLWNTEADPRLPRALDLNDERRKRAKARLKERSLPDWKIIIHRISASDFCRGINRPKTEENPWVATFDFLVQPGSAVKVLEGTYDNRSTGPPRPVTRVLSDVDRKNLYADPEPPDARAV